MSNIHSAFQQKDAAGKPRPTFIGFLTGGDPSIEKSEEFALELIRAGADLVEIGIPFSDPIAEGPVIQEANIRALTAGATVEKLFALVKSLRAKTAVPLVFLTYLNPVFHYGYDPFFRRAQSVGLDGIIIPDLPFEEQAELRETAAKYGVDLISLIAPTSDERIREIAKTASGFIYLVSSMGVTGVRSQIKTDLDAIITAVREATKVPVAVGFGIHTPAQAGEIGKIADGVIVGSAIVRIIAEHRENAGSRLYEYVRGMRDALTGDEKP